VLFSLFVSLGDNFDFNSRRLDAFTSILDGKISDEMVEDSRTQIWALYYYKVLNKPFFGNGYLSFSGKTDGIGENSDSIQGAHNTFLMILGESGIFVFLYFTAIYGGFIVSGIRVFKDEPFIFLISFSLFMYMLTSHNYFDNYITLFVSLWLYLKIDKKKMRKNLKEST
jgi:O-antigen ligase